MIATFNRFELELTEDQAMGVSVGGQDATEAVDWVLTDKGVVAQLDAIGAMALRDELTEYGAWDSERLADDDANRQRIVWIAGGNIREDR